MSPPTTGGKNELNIVCMRKSQHGTQNVKTHNRTTQKIKKNNNTDAITTKNRVCTQVLLLEEIGVTEKPSSVRP